MEAHLVPQCYMFVTLMCTLFPMHLSVPYLASILSHIVTSVQLHICRTLSVRHYPADIQICWSTQGLVVLVLHPAQLRGCSTRPQISQPYVSPTRKRKCCITLRESSGLNVGYWSPDCERWFQERLSDIRAGKAKLRTAQDWRTSIKNRATKTKTFTSGMDKLGNMLLDGNFNYWYPASPSG